MNTGCLTQNCIKTYGWDDSLANAAVDAYRAFFSLKQREEDWNARKLSPSPIVDQVWHMHLLDTLSYHAACGNNFIHHDPRGGVDEFARAKRYARTVELLGVVASEIWPEPLKYVYFSGRRNHMILWNPRLTMLKARDQLYRKFDISPTTTLIKLKGDLRPFAVISWSAVVRKRNRKRTRSETQTKQIFVKALNGSTYTVHVPVNGGSTLDLMQFVYDKDKIPPSWQRLIFAGRVLGSEECIDWLVKESTVHLVRRLRGC